MASLEASATLMSDGRPSYKEFLRRVVQNPGALRPTPRWAAVMDRLLVGSTYANQLCARFGYDPDEIVR